MRRFLAPHLGAPGERIHLDRRASHHLMQVLRMPRGAEVVAFDGQGNEVSAVLVDVEEDLAVLRIVGVPAAGPPAAALHLVLGLPRGPAMDTAVRMATEVGATHIHPFAAERSAARGDRADRWARIAVSAAQQCGRAGAPQIAEMSTLHEVLGALPEDLPRFVAVPGAERALARPAGGAALMIGPEGGLSPAELRRCLDAGATPLGLGPWVLRVETAVAVGLASLVP